MAGSAGKKNRLKAGHGNEKSPCGAVWQVESPLFRESVPCQNSLGGVGDLSAPNPHRSALLRLLRKERYVLDAVLD
jgi:hypothetical protein